MSASFWTTRPLVVGHRGGRGAGWPQENGLEAFERARREGARAIELDVRTCAGGDVVVWHDVTLSRIGDGVDPRRVSDVSVPELRARGVATLDEVLAWARSARVAVNVEMKPDVPSRLALARGTVRAVRASRADVLLSSFHPALLALTAVLAPDVPRALLVHAGQSAWADALQRFARPPWVTAIHLERAQVAAAGPAGLEPYRRRGLRVGVWTVNDPAEASALAAAGAASIITDAPGVVVRALEGAPQSTGSIRTPGGAL